MLRIHNVKVSLGKRQDKKILSQVLNIREKDILSVKLIKMSIDARRSHVSWICSYDFEVKDEEMILKNHPKVSRVEPYQYHYFPRNDQKVVIVGSGPAGLFCAYVLSMVGQDVTVIERGKKIEERVQDVDLLLKEGKLQGNSNIAFGEGGAGTFSDGKLTTGIKNERLSYVLETFVKHGAPQDILYLAKAHIGTDYLRKVIINMRKYMEEKGVRFLFDTQMIDFTKHDDRICVKVKHQKEISHIECDDLVLAIGHSARDTYEMLYQKGLSMEAKAFAVGVRIEQSQQKINQIQYKKSASSLYLKAASYKLAVHPSTHRGVYTFCMCPGGYVVPSSTEEGMLCVNGMSYYDRSGDNANSAILVNVTPGDFLSDHPLAGIAFQRDLEKKAYDLGKNGKAPVQRVMDYLNHTPSSSLGDIKPTFMPGYTLCDLHSLFPSFINESLEEGLIMMNKKMPGFIDEDVLLTGVEARSSAPVRLLRNQDYMSSISHIYPIGEGAGYAGGIMSAAVDGIMCAETILKGDKNGSC